METRESLQCNYQEHMTMTVMTLVTMTKDNLGNTRRGRVDCPPKTRGLWQTGKLFPKVEGLFNIQYSYHSYEIVEYFYTH